jgi:hypothetical protein
MPAPSWENLDDFLATDADGGFATVATVTLLDDTTRDITGIFDDPYLNAQLGEYDADSNDPRFMCKEADTAGIDRGCTMTIGGKVYDVLRGPQADGTGMATIKLATQE